MSIASASQLCTHCGICCDGTLFAFVAITGDEAQTLQAAGVAVHQNSGRLKLPQRCGALRGCLCTVYEKRPFVCRRFDCLLARALTDKELPLDEALRVVAEARVRLGRLDQLLPVRKANEPGGATLRAASLAQGGTGVSDSARQAFDEAQEYLRRHFVPD